MNKSMSKIFTKKIGAGDISHQIGLKDYFKAGNEIALEKAWKDIISCNIPEFLNLQNVENLEDNIPDIKGIRYPYECYICGKRPVFDIINGKLIEKEPHCVNLGDFSYEIDVPSGQLVFCDWMEEGRDYINSLQGDVYINVNFIKGRIEMSELYLKYNIGTFYVGNSDPHVLQNGNNIIIQSPQLDEDNNKYIIPDGFDDMGIIYTDLWWCTFFDLKSYQELIGKDVSFEEAGAHVFLNVEPGKYRIKYDVLARDEGKTTYLSIEKI